MDLKFYLSLFLRRLHYIVLLVLLGTGLGVTYAFLLPPRYVAEALLVVESQQIPDELAESTVRTDAIEQLQIIRQRILSRSNLLDLADQFEVYQAVEGEPLSPDEIVTDMRHRITIDTSGGRRNQPGATLVNVSFSASRAGLSAEVANELVTLILQENVERRTTVSGQTLDFFEREVQRLDEELSKRSSALMDFQEKNQASLPESLEFRRNQLISTQERQMEIDRQLTQLKDRRESLVTLYEETGSIGSDADGDGQMSAEERELRRLRERYASQSAVMSDANPRIKVLKSQIESLEKTVAGQSSGSEGDGESPGRSPYEVRLADIDNQIALLEDQRKQLDSQIEELRTTINQTPNNAVTLQSLQRDLENVRAQYDRAVENRARAETGDTIEALSKGQRISVIENAVAPGEPNSPNRKKIVVAGFGGGLLAGLGLIALLELLNTSVRRSSEIVEGLEITPIATLSYMRTRREKMRRRLLISGAFLIVAAGIPAGLWAIDTYYMPIDLVVQNIVDRLPDIAGITGGPTGTL